MIPHSKPTLSAEDAKVLWRAARSGNLVQGREVEAFEREMSRYVGRCHGVAVSSGTAALHVALVILGVRPGDEVIIPSYVCSALLQAVRAAQATPVLLDINPADFSFSASEIQKKKTRSTKALILPHVFGFPLDVSLYEKWGIPVIEDVAQALGAQWRGKKVGTQGRLAVCSFYATKLMTTGEGGMILCDEAGLARQAREWRSYDEKKGYAPAFNYKMTDFQAALGRSQLRRIPQFISKRRALAREYERQLRAADVILPSLSKDARPAYHRFVLRHPRAGELITALQRREIEARRPVFKPLHHYLGLRGGFPGTDTLFRELISVPLYPALRRADAIKIAREVKKITAN